jgi:serine/threonine protein kinase|tara:strand:+ start:7845 stop:8759 length:915 start_codon:yes stop_codon:yes gene_type:complete
MIDLDGYEYIKKLGTGAFGTVYKAKHTKSGNIVAIKIENKDKHSRLVHEYHIYKQLQKNNTLGFPKLYDYIEKPNNNICIMDYLGPSLEDLFEFSNNRFSIKTVLMIGIQVLNRIEELHNIGFIHRDIKPDNFLIGTGKKKSRIFLIDFGLSKSYLDDSSNHIEYKTDRNFTGSFRYSSIRNHKGIEQSRRDDLESIGYMLIFFLKGRLPWQGLRGSTKSKRSENIFNTKNTTSLHKLCDGIPKEFYLYMKYCRVLRFLQKPDYDLLRNLFIVLFKNQRYELDYVYDWNIVAKQKKKEMNRKST